MIIKVLGPGCKNCTNLERVTREAIGELGVDASIQKVEDYLMRSFPKARVARVARIPGGKGQEGEAVDTVDMQGLAGQ